MKRCLFVAPDLVHTGAMTDTVTILDHTTLAKAWGRLDSYSVRHRRLDGTDQTVTREVYDHGSAAAVLLYDPVAKAVVLTRQFRLPPHLNGDPSHLIEACAGLLDGDAPEACARREALEETGYAPKTLVFVCDAYMSPGSLTEKCACYVGTITIGDTRTAGGGLAHEGEDIEVITLPLAEALAMIPSRDIVDAKTIIVLQWLALNPGFGQ